MLQRYKLQIIFMSLTFGALVLFGFISYSTSYEIRMQQEINILKNFSQYVSQDLLRHGNDKKSLAAYLKSPNFLPADYYLILTHTKNNFTVTYPENLSQQLHIPLVSQQQSQGSFVFNNKIYTWNKEQRHKYDITLLHQLPNDTVARFFKAFGIPLIVTGIIIMWIIFWATFMLNKLFIKLSEKNKSMHHMMNHDALTGLPNRFLFQDRIDQEIKTSKRKHTTFAVIYIDLNRFKDINDTLGHHIGDKLLVALSSSLKQHMRESDTAARLGGDEFALLAPHTDINSIDIVIERLQTAFHRTYMIEENKLYVDASMGVAFFPEHGIEPSTLTQRADMAMYKAKTASKTFSIYNTKSDEKLLDRLTLANDLRHAIEKQQFELYYQPQFNSKIGKCDHIETLIRWNHPEKGFISPADFIPLAETTGYIRSISQWVLKKAIAQCGEWKKQGYKFNISINLSTWDIQETSLPERIQLLANAHQVEPSDITIEITETAIMSNLKRARTVLSQLANDGVGVSLDDFGTGYSSLNHLRQFPINEVKIDSSFIMSMLSNREDLSLVKAIIDLCHDLNIEVVAEGVENISAQEKLLEFSCDRLQGFYFSKPVPADKVLNNISEWEKIA